MKFLILVGFFSLFLLARNSQASQFVDEVNCDKKLPSSCLRMALRDLGSADSKKLLSQLSSDPKKFKIESRADDQAMLAAGALQFGNTLKDKTFLETLELSCNTGSAFLCFARFSTLSRPGNTSKEKLESKAWLKKANLIFENECKNGNGFSCLMQAQFQPMLDETLLPSSMSLFAKSCDLGEPQACLIAGEDKLAKQEDKQPAFELLKKACELNYSKACYKYAAFLNNSGQNTEALEISKKKCKEEVGISCLLAAIWINKKAPGDPSGDSFYNQACDLNILQACDEFAVVLAARGNTSRALQLLSSACFKEHADSCFQKGKIEETLGNKTESVALFKKSCDLNSASGCLLTGMAKLNEQVAAKKKTIDVKPGQPFFEKAQRIFASECEDGSDDSCEKLKNLVQLQQKIGIKSSR